MTITGLAHTALHVADVDAAVAWYRDVLGLRVLSPPYRMEGDRITADMGELVPAPVVVKAAIVGVSDDDDRVIEVIEYPGAPGGAANRSVRARARLHPRRTRVRRRRRDPRRARGPKGVRFLVDGIADVAGLRTTWFADPWDNVFILVEKVAPPRPRRTTGSIDAPTEAPGSCGPQTLPRTASSSVTSTKRLPLPSAPDDPDDAVADVLGRIDLALELEVEPLAVVHAPADAARRSILRHPWRPPPVLSDNGRRESGRGRRDHWMSDTAATITATAMTPLPNRRNTAMTRTDTPLALRTGPSTLVIVRPQSVRDIPNPRQQSGLWTRIGAPAAPKGAGQPGTALPAPVLTAAASRQPASGANGVAMYQLWPSGSRTPYSRCPYSSSVGSRRMVAPFALACSKCASTSLTCTTIPAVSAPTVRGVDNPPAACVQPDPSLAGADLGVDHGTITVLHDSGRGEAEHRDEEVVPRANVFVGNDRDDVRACVRHAPSLRIHVKGDSRPRSTSGGSLPVLVVGSVRDFR